MNTLKTVIYILIGIVLLYKLGPVIINNIARAVMKPGWRCYTWEWKSKKDLTPQKEHGRISSIDSARGLVSIVLDNGTQVAVEKNRVFFI